MNKPDSCPISKEYPQILVAHGGGGKLMHELIEKMFIPTFQNPLLESRHDGAILELGNTKLAFTTDSYVVDPLFFPGGNIGTLAINGTVNDLAMCGARPMYLSTGIILEEGLETNKLRSIIKSMGQAAETAGVKLVTGDTKVVDRGKGDGVFINTTGIGIIEHNLQICPASVRPGDAIILSGDIGRHGVAIMAKREGLSFETTIESDCTSLEKVVLEMLEANIQIHCLRDLTRGGLATSLIEIAEAADVSIQIEENAIPVLEEVQGACEILGLDPIYIANEGRFVCFVPPSQIDQTLQIIDSHMLGGQACVIGTVLETGTGVKMKSCLGVNRIVNMLSGEQLPRIC